MNRKSASIVILLLSVGVLSAFKIQPVRASEAIYIRADGSIDPPTAPISSVDNVTYVVTGNIIDRLTPHCCIVVERNNIVVDGRGYTLWGGTLGFESRGIDLNGRSNVTIRNAIIRCFHFGIYLHDSNYNRIAENIMMNNDIGVILVSSSNNTVSGNMFFNDGLVVDGSYDKSARGSCDNVVMDNSVNGKPLVYLENVSDRIVGDAGQVILINCNDIIVENLSLSCASVGIALWGTNSTRIARNGIAANWRGIYLVFSSNNTVYGNDIAANGAGCYLGLSDYNNISGNNITSNGEGIELFGSANNSISENNMANNADGICLTDSNYNRISGNKITANDFTGIYFIDSNYNRISGNKITANDFAGIFSYSSNNNSIVGNNIVNNHDGVSLCGSYNIVSGNNVAANNGSGIYFDSFSDYNNISGNNITSNNGWGIYLCGSANNISGNNITSNNGDGILLSYFSNNSISANNIAANNGWGIWLHYSSGNRIYHNNFVNNIDQVAISEASSIFDDGYPSGGNYWSDYSGIDSFKGPGQDGSGSDGIGDTPYTIAGGNMDKYPLMTPYQLPNQPIHEGDVNQDGRVDIRDIAVVSSAFGSYPGHARWDLLGDLNSDGRIDTKDLARTCANFGWHR